MPDEPFDNDPAPNMERLASESKERPGTYPLHRTAYLQRLADPDLAYHPEYNPYITIDWMNMDLTVFNGEDTEPVDDPARVDGGGAPAPYVAPVEEKSIASGVAFSIALQRWSENLRRRGNSGYRVTMAQATATPRYTFTDPTIPDVQTGVSIFSASTAYLIRSTPQPVLRGPRFHLTSSMSWVFQPPLRLDRVLLSASSTSVASSFESLRRVWRSGKR